MPTQARRSGHPASPCPAGCCLCSDARDHAALPGRRALQLDFKRSRTQAPHVVKGAESGPRPRRARAGCQGEGHPGFSSLFHPGTPPNAPSTLLPTPPTHHPSPASHTPRPRHRQALSTYTHTIHSTRALRHPGLETQSHPPSLVSGHWGAPFSSTHMACQLPWRYRSSLTGR